MLDFPATSRNREPIALVLGRWLPASRPLSILEVASGSGQHAVYFCQRFAHWNVQPTDPEPAHLASIKAYRRQAALPNLAAPLELDVLDRPWPVKQRFDAILAINLLHISPWECTRQLFAQAVEYLDGDGALYLYGAFFRDGVHTAPSNKAFDESLRRRDPAWGVRRLEEVTALAEHHGFRLDRLEEMPANNLSVLWRLKNLGQMNSCDSP